MSPKITPADLYAMTPESVSHDTTGMNGCYYQHIPEVDGYTTSEENERTKRFERRILKHVYYDYRRYWELATIWFDGKPVMITQNAGREGDDHARRFITDPAAYASMVGYLLTLQDRDHRDVVSADGPRDDLLSFYGDEMRAPEPTP